ncbi:MAG: translocation/assembly module TamB, partial [Candidatus Riflebacteria bacterium]|nr:translocation/assembly module TamB [Candidatus Riflebacteria bacterium]
IQTDDRELGNYGGEVIIDSEKLEIKNGEFDRLGIKLSGDLMWGARQPYNFKLDLDNVDFSFIPQSHDMTIFENGSILVNGNCVVQGDLASLTPDLVDVKLDNIQIKKDDEVIVTNKPILVKYQNENLEIRSFELKYKLGILSVEGLISAAKDIGIIIKGENFSAKALGHLFGLKDINFDGDLSLNGRVYGTTDNIKYSSQAEINKLTVEGKEIPLVQAKIEGDSKLLKIEETFVKLKNNSFDLKGNIALDNFVPNRLDVKLSIPNGPISDLSEYLPKVIKEADGSINGELNITGNPSNPEITGDLHLNGKKIQLTSMKKPFTNVEFDMTTDDMITTVNTLKASMGKGLIEGYGKVDFKNALGALDVHLRTEKLDLPFMSLEIFNASAAVDLTGDIYNPVFFSNIYIPRGRLGLNMNLIPESSDSKPIFNSLKYRVNVEIPRNFWVKNAFLNAEMKGKCSVNGDLENFKIEGGISTIQGKIFFKQRQFKIQNGEIRFGGVDNSLDPYIYVKSEGQVQSTKIYMTLTGNISNFKPQVYSTPPMSEGDIIAMLTLGRDLNAVSNSNTKDLFEDEVLEGLKNSYISSLIGNQISSALNLDELYLTSAFDKKTGKTQSYVRIGKYLSDKIFMAYEGNMSDDKDESYIFEYRLPKGFIFSIEFEQPENNQNYGIRYDWKF